MPRPPTRVILPSLALAVLTAQSQFAAPLPLAPDGWQAASGSVGTVTRSPPPNPRPALAPPDLLISTLPLDISTSSFYELVDWTRSLGLSDSGGAEDLRARLYEYFKVKPPSSTKSGGRSVVISAANQATYSGGSGDQGVVSLSGGVVLSITEDGGNTYRISARQVVYDRGRNSVYASGTVVYTRTTQGRTEEFRGSTLAADLDDWSGLFLDGVWRQQGTSIGSGDRGLTFSSSTLERISGDYITLGDATVSSGTSKTPNFSVHAKRLWFVGESDWAALSALIYVGEVPLLWMPFFYYPSEEIVFHPVFGFRSREGSFLQTTTWLVGQKPASTTNNAIIQFAPVGGPTEVRGIFLKHVPGKGSSGQGTAANPSAGPAAGGGATGANVATAAGAGAAALAQAATTTASTSSSTSTDSVMLLGDWYSGLGAFAGLDASLKPAGIVTRFDLSSGIGFSRSLFPGILIYSPFSEYGNWQSVWNNSYIFGQQVPFRFGGQLSMGLTLGPVRTTFDLPVYSDSYFEQDFRNRSYDMDWLGMSNSTNVLTTSTIAARTALSQKLTLTAAVPVNALSPWLQNFGLTLNSSFNWLSKTDYNLANSESTNLYQYDPARQFFYPDSLRPVDLSLSLGGSLLDYPGSLTSSATPPVAMTSSTKNLPVLHSPWAAKDQKKASTVSTTPLAQPDFPDPPAAPDPALPTPPIPLSSKVTWNLQPGLVLERRYLSDPWKGESSIDYSPLWDLASWRLGATLGSSVALFGPMLSGSYNLSWAEQEQARQLTANSAYASTTSSVLLSDAQYANRRLSGTLSLVSQPLPVSSLFSPSSVSWNFSSTLFSWAFDHFANLSDPTSAVYVTRLPEWSNTAISANSVGLTLAVITGPVQQSLAFSASLPPLTESYSATLALAAKPAGWTFGLGGQARYARQTGGGLKPSPFSASASVASPIGLSLQDSLTWDFDLASFSSNAATATWGWATATLQSQYAQQLTPVAGVGWQAAGGSAFIPASFSATIAPRLDPQKDADFQPTLSSSLSYTQSLIRFSDSLMIFGVSVNLRLGAGFSLDFSTQSQNSLAWKYWPQFFSIPSSFGSPDAFRVDPIADIGNSLKFWDSASLQKGNFKLKNLSFRLSQDLDDWTLAASASATPTLSTDGTYWYINPSFSVNIAWKDIPMLKSAIVYQNSNLSW